MPIVRQVLAAVNGPGVSAYCGVAYNDSNLSVSELFASADSMLVSFRGDVRGEQYAVEELVEGERKLNVSAAKISATLDPEGAVVFPFSLQMVA